LTDVYGGGVPCPVCRRPLAVASGASARCPCGREVQVWRFRPFRASRAPVTFLDGASAPCAYHAGNRAESACARCGSFLCGLCVTTVRRQTLCVSCFERMRAAGEDVTLKNRIPRPHVVALSLGVASMLLPVFAVFLVPLVAWQGRKALQDRARLSEREGGVVLLTVLGLAAGVASLALLVLYLRAVIRP
jgi:hypothetical protein